MTRCSWPGDDSTDQKLRPLEREARERVHRVRMYDFTELLSLVVAAELRRGGKSLQSIRRIVWHVRKRGYDRPLAQLTYALVEGTVYFQHPGGEREFEGATDQIVIHETLDLETLRIRVRTTLRRPAASVGQIEKRRGVRGGQPVVAGTRVPVDTIRRYLAHGRTPSEVQAAFPVLQLEDVEAVARLAATA